MKKLIGWQVDSQTKRDAEGKGVRDRETDSKIVFHIYRIPLHSTHVIHRQTQTRTVADSFQQALLVEQVTSNKSGSYSQASTIASFQESWASQLPAHILV